MFLLHLLTLFFFTGVLAAQKYAEAVTVVQEGSNVIVKLDCVGCPFSLRKNGEESWEETPRENALMLNFSLGHSQDALLLNDKQIIPLPDPPPFIDAYQTEANLTAAHLDFLIDYQFFNCRFGKSEGSMANFGLSYDRSISLATDPNNVILHFDVIGWSQAAVNEPAQQMVSVELGSDSTGMIIQAVSLVPRPPPYRGDSRNKYPFWCPTFLESTVDYLLSRPRHPDPPHHMVFRIHEWDEFGRKGTLRHDWDKYWVGPKLILLSLMVINGVLFVILVRAAGFWRVIKMEIGERASKDEEQGSEECEKLMDDEEQTWDEEMRLPPLPDARY